MGSDWYVYVLECDDETLYTGITKDPKRRIREHNETKAGARYTRARRPVRSVAHWGCADRSEAATGEAAFKSLTRDEKVKRIRVAAPLEVYRAFEAEYLRVFAFGDVDAEACRPIALAGADERFREAAETVQETFERVRDECRSRLPDSFPVSPDEIGPIWFVGPGLFDGHAVLVDGEPLVFFDARLVEMHLRDEEFHADVHATHESIHALHYGASPAMYPGRDKGPREAVWHRLVAEGLATRISEIWRGCAPEVSLWFGLIDEATYDEWRGEARRRRDEIWEAVGRSDGRLRFDSEVWTRLFRGRGELHTNRLGYLYGREIVERAEADHDVEALLELPPRAWEPYVAAYFEGGEGAG